MLASNSTCAEEATLPLTSSARVIQLAERRLRSDSHLVLSNLSCDFRDGFLVLRGVLSTYYLKQLAQEVVADLAGAERIDNQIEVITPAVRSCWH